MDEMNSVHFTLTMTHITTEERFLVISGSYLYHIIAQP